jgi:hypothetical protein
MRLTLVARAGTLVAVAAAVSVFAFAGPASAHVTVNPNTATQGGYTKLTFRVPNKKANANTVALEVNLPAIAGAVLGLAGLAVALLAYRRSSPTAAH